MISYGENARVPILELQKSDSVGIQEVAQYVYENIFLKYTMKQWNQKPEEVGSKRHSTCSCIDFI